MDTESDDKGPGDFSVWRPSQAMLAFGHTVSAWPSVTQGKAGAMGPSGTLTGTALT